MQGNSINPAFKKIERGGSSDNTKTLFGVDCNEEFAQTVASQLDDLRINLDENKTIIDMLPTFPERKIVDLHEEIDKLYGAGVAKCLILLGVKLTSAIVCGCGKLGVKSSLEYTNLSCSKLEDECKFYALSDSHHGRQDIQPNMVAKTVAMLTGHVSLGTNLRFIEMLGALAGYPFRCACGNPVTCLDAPLTVCDFCATMEGVADFVKHMDADARAPTPVELLPDVEVHSPSFIDRIFSGVKAAKNKVGDMGSHIYALIAELITTIGNYFNSVVQHYGSHFYEGIKSGFQESISSISRKLKSVLGSEGMVFLFVAVVASVIIRFAGDLVANFIINTSLALFEMMKDLGDSVFAAYTRVYKAIVDHLKSDNDDDDEIILHAAKSDGCVAMIATLFCTFATATGSIGSVNILRSIAAARHVVSGMEVAKSALLWLVERFPLSLQSFLWDTTGLGTFECQDEELMELIVVLRESLLELRKDSTAFLGDLGMCRCLLTAHTMLTRAVMKNSHGWNPTQNSIIRAMLSESKEFIGRAQATVDRDIGRVEPVGLILQGPPGIGKTALIEVLAARLNPNVPRSMRSYYKNLKERFWSGYCEQPVLVLDDYGAIKDDQAESSLAADILRIISPSEMALDMAFDKGTVFCKSNLVVLTTNRNMNAPQTFLTSNTAFMRRFIYCTVSIKKEFVDANGLLNTAKLRGLPIEQSLTFPHLNFRIHERFKKGSNSAGLYDLSQQDRTLEELLLVLQAHIMKKTVDAQFLHDAAEKVAPTPIHTDAYVDFRVDVKSELIKELREKRPDEYGGVELDQFNSLRLPPMPHKSHVGHDLVPEFEPQMLKRAVSVASGISQSTPEVSQDNNQPRPYRPATADESSDDEPYHSSDDGYGLGLKSEDILDELKGEMLDKHESLPNGIVFKPKPEYIVEQKLAAKNKPSKYKNAATGLRIGKKGRQKIREEEVKSGEEDDTYPPFIDEFGIPWSSGDLAVRAAAYLDSSAEMVYVKTSSMREQTEKFKKVIGDAALEVMSRIKDNPLKSLGIVAACATTIALCVKAFTMVTESRHEPQMRTKYNSDHARRRPEIAHRRRYAPLVRHNLDSETDKGVINKISANCGYLDRAGGRVGCFFVKGNVFRTVTHFFRTSATADRWLPDGTPFSVFAREGDEMVEYKMSFNMEFVLPYEDENGLIADWLYYNCGTRVPPKKNMVGFHVSEKMFTHRRDFRSVLMVRTDSVSRGTTAVVRCIANTPAVQYSSIDGSKRPDVYIPTAIMSNYDCDHGDCGYPIVGKVDGQYKILSLHVGVRSKPLGSESTSAVVTMSEVNTCLDMLSQGFPIILQSKLTDVTPSKPAVELNDSYTYCGKLDWAPKGISSKTKYKKSLINSSIDKKIIFEPSIMGDSEDVRTSKTPREVLADIANRADSTLEVMPKKLVMLAGDALFESIITRIPVDETTRIHTLSLDEALNGDGRFVDRYPTAGSPGIPSTLKRKHGVTGKHGIMDQDRDGRWHISDPECAARIEHLHKSFSEGVVEPYFNQFCIKDETLKCNELGVVKKTRGIKCAPIESNLCGKRYFGGMVCLFKQFFHCIPFKCGMNVFSSDWDDFIKWHLEVGDVGFDGDIGGQENIIKGEIYDELYRFTNRIYAHYGETPTEEEKRQRASYLASLCHYYMVIGPDLFRAKFGNPSGNWLTAFICSFTSGILLGVAYFGLAMKHDPMKANVHYFLSLVRMSLSGDDNFVSRSSLLDWFTGANVSRHLKDNYGYMYTDAKKALTFPPDRDVIMLNFLACNTRLSDEYAGITYMACIDDGPLEKCVQYVSKKAANGDEYIAIVDNANTALDLVWTSGKKRFDEYRQKYLRAFVDTPDCNVPVLHDFNFCEQRFLEKELLSENYFGDDYLFLPHMLKAPEQVNPEFQDAQVNVVAGPTTSTDTQVTYNCTERTVLEPAKRFSSMYDCPEVKSPVPSYVESVSSAFLTRQTVSGDFRPMAGPLAWFAGPFAAWSGDLRFGFKCSSELLIRTDATERLANAVAPPKLIANDISSMCPFDYTSPDHPWALVQIPSTIPYKFNILPKITGEEKYRQTTSASFLVDTASGVDRSRLTILASAGDNYSTHFLFMVPSINIARKFYAHNRNYQDALPEYLSLKNTPGAPPFPFTQASVIINYKDQGTVDSDGSVITAINYRTEVFGDTELIALGVVATAPVNRRYDPGAVREVECDMKNCVARSMDIEVQPGGVSSGANGFNLDPTVAVVRGTSYVDPPVEMASGWYLTYQAYDNPLVRVLLNGTGIPASEIVIPTAQSGFEHSPAESYIVPAVNSAVGFLGGDYILWDSTPTYPKAFYATPILPFKDEEESKDGYSFIRHMSSNDHGIGFTNVVDAPIVTTDRKPQVARKQMGEEKYSFDSFVDRYQLIRSFQWDDTQVQGTVLDSRSVPYQCIGSTTKAAFNKFCYWSGDVEIKVQVQSTAFVCGKLIIVFAPFCDPARASYLQLPSLISMSAAPNVTVMAGNTTEVTMMIPYAHYKNYLNTDGEAGDPFSLLGTVSVVVFNKLRVAAGGTDYCTVNVYSRFRNSNFQMLRPPPIDGNVPVHSFIMHGAAMSMAKNVSGVVDDVTDAVSRVGAVAEYALDAPNVGVNYTPVFNRAAPMLNHSTNVHYLNVMDMHPGQQSLADVRDVASSIPECTLSYLLTKPTFLNTFSIKDSDIEGEVYMVLPMTPTMKLFNAPLSSLVDETLMGYVAAPFKYWRGGFKLNIEVVATSVHTARLVVATHYGGASSSVSMDNIMAQNAEILEIGAGQNTFEVILPWRAPTQWLETPAGPPVPTNPFEVSSSARYSMGEVSIRLLTRLQTMPSVSPEIDCNVYVSMTDDAELSYIGMNTADLVPVFVPNSQIIP
ncbi:hypothetical protein [Wenzhou picorna-like virus 45]|uniref:hypothetical protein n=1 Tax=Wenzhou picorna-like virus 45 TaxID=1923632 RepID=UPI00090A4E6D|nr:hypothetical protein [Wenzhou picorna-like virus 45]APG78552.1 hypothetical protein [Wenzhou picorna-like virus 45]